MMQMPGNNFGRTKFLLGFLLVALSVLGVVLFREFRPSSSAGFVANEKKLVVLSAEAEAGDDWTTLGLDLYPFTITDEYVKDILLLADVFGRNRSSQSSDLTISAVGHPIAAYGVSSYRDAPRKAYGERDTSLAPPRPEFSLYGIVETPGKPVLLMGRDSSGKNLLIEKNTTLGSGWIVTKLSREHLWAEYQENPEFTCSFDVQQKLLTALNPTEPKEEEDPFEKRKKEEERRRQELASGADENEKTDRKYKPEEVRGIWQTL